MRAPRGSRGHTFLLFFHFGAGPHLSFVSRYGGHTLFGGACAGSHLRFGAIDLGETGGAALPRFLVRQEAVHTSASAMAMADGGA
jgi:hypothetical protein